GSGAIRSHVGHGLGSVPGGLERLLGDTSGKEGEHECGDAREQQSGQHGELDPDGEAPNHSITLQSRNSWEVKSEPSARAAARLTMIWGRSRTIPMLSATPCST